MYRCNNNNNRSFHEANNKTTAQSNPTTKSLKWEKNKSNVTATTEDTSISVNKSMKWTREENTTTDPNVSCYGYCF